MITPDAALLIIKGWFENESTVHLSVSSVNVSAWMKSKVVSVDGSKAVFRSNNGDATVTLVVEAGFSFEYKQLREVSGMPGFESVPAGRLLNSAVTASLPNPSGRGDLVQLVLIES